MNPFTALGSLWASCARRSRRFQQADETDEQSHVNHALVIVLLFGTVAAGVGMMARRGQLGFRIGLLAGLVFYLAREVHQRWRNWRLNLWDGVCDVLVPCWIILPAVLQSLELLWGLSAAVAVMYFLLRPLKP